MCGIAGIMGDNATISIGRMTKALAHRGPDGEGVYISPDQRVALGHTRLSIIDLSPKGHQPMSYDGRYWIVFNGEIYNYTELRDELKALGYKFFTNTDTEVILVAYIQWGNYCLKRLRGMFAFAIWDSHFKRLFMARDRLGIKPLYYSQRQNVFAFASEVRALLKSGFVSSEIDRQSLWYYLSFGVIPQPHTIFSQIKALLPGYYAEFHFETQTLGMTRYWDIAEETAPLHQELATLTYEETQVILRQKLEEATRYHLVSDVPVAAFLSGGIDSTGIVGLMSCIVRCPIKTFSVGFESKYKHLDERRWAKIAAEKLGTEHTEVIITGNEVANSFDQLVSSFDQPSVDGTNTYFVSRAASKEVKVALSGLGADELFLGYYHFHRISRAANIFPNGIPKGHLGSLIRFFPGRWRRELAALIASPMERLLFLRQLVDEEKLKQITKPEAWGCLEFPSFDMQSLGILDLLSQISYVEITGYLRNTLLRDADNMGMAHGLEIRPPYLDHVLAEFVFALPSSSKLQKQHYKKLLVDAINDILPKEIVQRPKMGFEMPLSEWMGTVLKERLLAAFDSDYARTIFMPQFLSDLRMRLSKRKTIPRYIWAYFVLLEYFRIHECQLK